MVCVVLVLVLVLVVRIVVAADVGDVVEVEGLPLLVDSCALWRVDARWVAVLCDDVSFRWLLVSAFGCW